VEEKKKETKNEDFNTSTKSAPIHEGEGVSRENLRKIPPSNNLSRREKGGRETGADPTVRQNGEKKNLGKRKKRGGTEDPADPSPPTDRRVRGRKPSTEELPACCHEGGNCQSE